MTDEERAWFKLSHEISHMLRCLAGDLDGLASVLEEKAKQKSYLVYQIPVSVDVETVKQSDGN